PAAPQLFAEVLILTMSWQSRALRRLQLDLISRIETAGSEVVKTSRTSRGTSFSRTDPPDRRPRRVSRGGFHRPHRHAGRANVSTPRCSVAPARGSGARLARQRLSPVS